VRHSRWGEEALAEKLGVIQQTVNTWILDIHARRKQAETPVSIVCVALDGHREKSQTQLD